MIRTLRRRHRWMIAILAVAVLMLFFAALAARPEFPLEEGFSGTFAPPVEAAGRPAAHDPATRPQGLAQVRSRAVS